MIYRILHDEAYLMHVIPPVESMRKLGDTYGTFAFNAEPVPYQNIWKPLEIEFGACDGSKTTKMPDVSENFGRLFFSEKAFRALNNLLKRAGEFLPVSYGDQSGYVFNPLHTADECDGLDTASITKDEYGNVTYFGFHEAKLTHLAAFKTRLDLYKGVFCTGALKDAYEKAGLVGVLFSRDVSNPLAEAHGVVQ